jgi:CubicO group peptidase (beta-lactamase class C family)
MRLLKCLGVLVLLSEANAHAAQLTEAGAAELDSYLQTAIATTHIPGMVALVLNADGIIYEKAFGLMDSAAQKPMTTDAIFRLASMTKAVTSTAIMLLVEQGRISLDAPAADYLPVLASPRVFTSFNAADGTYTAQPAAAPITVRQLLTHTSGLGYTFTSSVLNQLMSGTIGARATSFPLLFEPGNN